MRPQPLSTATLARCAREGRGASGDENETDKRPVVHSGAAMRPPRAWPHCPQRISEADGILTPLQPAGQSKHLDESAVGSVLSLRICCADCQRPACPQRRRRRSRRQRTLDLPVGAWRMNRRPDDDPEVDRREDRDGGDDRPGQPAGEVADERCGDHHGPAVMGPMAMASRNWLAVSQWCWTTTPWRRKGTGQRNPGGNQLERGVDVRRRRTPQFDVYLIGCN